jgi:hypothetical protein
MHEVRPREITNVVRAPLIDEVFILKAVALHPVLKSHLVPIVTTRKLNRLLTRFSPDLHGRKMQKASPPIPIYGF